MQSVIINSVTILIIDILHVELSGGYYLIMFNNGNSGIIKQNKKNTILIGIMG